MSMSIKQFGGAVNNPAGQTISGYGYGVWIYGAAGTVTNAGAIIATGTYSHGVTLGVGGTVTNTGTITAAGYDARGRDDSGYAAESRYESDQRYAAGELWRFGS